MTSGDASAANVISVRGNASAEEVAAVLAVVRPQETADERSAYDRWRAARLAAVRKALDEGCATIVR
jgi:hypothetical protein